VLLVDLSTGVPRPFPVWESMVIAVPQLGAESGMHTMHLLQAYRPDEEVMDRLRERYPANLDVLLVLLSRRISDEEMEAYVAGEEPSPSVYFQADVILSARVVFVCHPGADPVAHLADLDN
jgi:hypothetical protein